MTHRTLALLLWASLTSACDDLWSDTADAGGGAPTPAPSQPADAAAPPVAAFADAEPAEAGFDAAANDVAAKPATAADAAAADVAAPDAVAGDASAADAAADAGSAQRAFVVGTTRSEIAARDGRVLPLQLWYPAADSARAEAAAGHPVSAFEPPGPRRVLLEQLLAGAPESCASRRMHAAFDAPVHAAAAPYPLLVYSHHLEGLRIAQFSAAEALAGLGFLVAAPDHSEMTLFDRTDDLQTADLLATLLRFRLDGLALRATDIEDVIESLLSGASALPEGIRGKVDPARVGVFGHSLGAATVAVVAARDVRVKAAAYLSFPPAAQLTLLNLFEQPAIERFRVPALFMLNREDGWLGLVGGNDALRAQFDAHPPLAYLVEVRDTGHWSFADDCALIPDFADGCGEGTRSAEPFETYANLNNAQARALAARNLGAFFGSQFLGLPAAAIADAASALEVVRSHPARDGR